MAGASVLQVGNLVLHQVRVHLKFYIAKLTTTSIYRLFLQGCIKCCMLRYFELTELKDNTKMWGTKFSNHDEDVRATRCVCRPLRAQK